MFTQVHLCNLLQGSSHLGINVRPSSRPVTSEDRCDTGHFPTTIAAAFLLAGTLAVHLALVPAEAKRGQGKVHLGAGARLFWEERGARGNGRREMQGEEHSSSA